MDKYLRGLINRASQLSNEADEKLKEIKDNKEGYSNSKIAALRAQYYSILVLYEKQISAIQQYIGNLPETIEGNNNNG